MNAALYLIPLSILLALCALAVFIWTVRSGQYDDLEGERYRILEPDDPPQETKDCAPGNTPQGKETAEK